MVQKTWSKGNPITAVKKKEKNKKFNLNYRSNVVFCVPTKHWVRGSGTGDWGWFREWGRDWVRLRVSFLFDGKQDTRDRGWDRDRAGIRTGRRFSLEGTVWVGL